ncbi:HSP70-domain-containing protein [Artomyces pyxidatus]|uniref:HSP70-domain-containing protein n=1 Tax=Artomyces pyxidatus TaxID=48021 RepID=A0ACB8SHP4_9AGAM|nr:HSP70-domain-containing protein [Artomyces pyxidatus]
MSLINEELQQQIAQQNVDVPPQPLNVAIPLQDAVLAPQDVGMPAVGAAVAVGDGLLAGGGLDGGPAQMDGGEAGELAVGAIPEAQDVNVAAGEVEGAMGAGAWAGGGVDGAAAQVDGGEAGGQGVQEAEALERQATKDAGSISILNIFRIINEFNTATAIAVFDGKRLIGRRFDDAEYRGEDEKSPEETSHMVLVEMKETAKSHLRTTMKNTVVTIRTYFKGSQCQVTKDAGTVSCPNVFRVINETAATAVAYGLNQKAVGGRSVLGFDLGGGAFELSLLTIEEGTLTRPPRLEGRQGERPRGLPARQLRPYPQHFQTFNGEDPRKSINPDEVVACGAAVQAAILSGDASEKTQDLLLFAVRLSLDLLRLFSTQWRNSLETAGGTLAALVNRNRIVPTEEAFLDSLPPGASLAFLASRNTNATVLSMLKFLRPDMPVVDRRTGGRCRPGNDELLRLPSWRARRRASLNAEGARTTPFVVTLPKHGERLVGLPAERQAVVNSANMVFAFKRSIGRQFTDKDVKGDMKHCCVAVQGGSKPDGRPAVEVEFNDKTQQYSVKELSSMVLSKMRETAEQFLNKKVNHAVITITGPEVLRVVNEPVTTALAYGLDRTDNSVIAKGVFEVKSTNGDTLSAGEDFDIVLVNHIMDEFKETGGNLGEEHIAIQRISEAAEKAKIELSSTSQTEISLPFITADATGPKHINLKLNRAQFEALVVPLIARTADACKKALGDAGVKAADINEVILIGASGSRHAVAIGASIQGGVLEGNVTDILLLDLLGNFNLVRIHPTPKGIPQIEITFDIDADDIVNVSAKDKATSKDQSMTIDSSFGLSDEDIERMVSDAEQYAESDKAHCDVIEESNKAESVCADTEKAMAEFKDQLDVTEKDKVTKHIADLRELAEKGQVGDGSVAADAIREKIGESQQASLGLLQKVYEKCNAENSASAAPETEEKV